MNKITIDQLCKIMPTCSHERAGMFIDSLNEAMDHFNINTKERQAAFLAQVAVESGSLHYTAEIASGEAYEGRKDLGNINPGDGEKYKGRGLIQDTGRAVAEALTQYFGVDFINHPELLEGVHFAAMSAGWYWMTKDLNILADTPQTQVHIKGILHTYFDWICYKVNGGWNGYPLRLKTYQIALTVL